MLTINPEKEAKQIISFLKQTFATQKISHAVIGISGGIDSATSLFLIKKVLPASHITAIHLPYNHNAATTVVKIFEKANLPDDNIITKPIRSSVDLLIDELAIPRNDLVRRGNIMARTRMQYLFDYAKKLNAMVVGTENRSEHYLGYFTRFGDAASDIEPIVHLYKTQVRQLAIHLGVPQEILDAEPTAGLWDGQTDEKEFGFTYQEADEVLYLHFEKKLTLNEIQKTHPNAKKILDHVKKNDFKLNTPYTLLD